MSRKSELLALMGERFPALVARASAASIGEADRTWLARYQKRTSDWPSIIERWLDGLDLVEDQALVLSGFGDGRQVAALLKRLPLGSYVFCLEKNVSRFLLACEQAETRHLLENPRLFVGVGDLGQDFFESLSRFPSLEVKGALPLIFAPLFNEDSEYYAAGFTEFARSLEYWRKLVGTNVTASGKWQKNTLANVPILIGAPDVSVFRNKFKGDRMIIASAGPSLDESLDFLREKQKDCVIVAVNSSYRALRNAGIVPHFVLAADPYEFTDMGFEGVDCSETVLICPFIVYPKVVERFKGRVATWSKNNVLASYLRSRIGLGLGSNVLEFGTVSACVFDIVVLFGCDRLLFLGQDLAFKDDGQMHAADSFYADLNQNQFAEKTFRTVPGNTLETVKVDEKLGIYLNVFESIARSRSDGPVEFLNSSRLGAKVPGIEYRSLAEAAQWVSGGPKNLESRWMAMKPLLAIQENWVERAFSEMKKMQAYVDDVCRKSLAMAVSLELGLDGGDCDSNLEALVLEAKDLKKALDASFEDESELFSVLSDGSLKYEQILYKRALREIPAGGDSVVRGAREFTEYYWMVSEAFFTFSTSITEALEDSAHHFAS